MEFEHVSAIVAIFFPMAVMAIAFALMYTQSKRRRAALRLAAMKLGLQYSEGIEALPEAARQQLEARMGPVSTTSVGSGSTGFLKALLNLAAPWQIEGRFNGSKVRVDMVTYGSGKSKTRYTRLRAFMEQPLELGLQILPENLLTWFGERVLGMDDIKLGNEALDKKLRIRAENESGVRSRFANPGLQAQLLALAQKYGRISLNDEEVSVEMKSTLTDEVVIRGALSDLSAIELALRS